MRAYLVASALLLFACSSSTPSSPGDGGSGTDASGGDAGTTDDGGADAGLYLPAGYTLVPFLSDSATTHTFAQADQVMDPSKDYVGVLDTDAGRIVMHLLSQDAPIACNSFIFLTLHHFYDSILFHRVIDGFMAQTGDPNTISGAPASWGGGTPGYSFDLEVTPSLAFDAPGVVGMANTGQPNSNGSQFFITFVAYPSLNQKYTIWAKVTEGLDVLPLIARGQPPATPTRIVDAYIGAK